MIITNDIHGTLQFHTPEATDVKGVPAMLTLKAAGSFGVIIHQSISSQASTVHYFNLEIHEEVTLHFSSVSEASIKSSLCLQDEMMWRVKDQDIPIQKDQYIIYNGAVKTASLLCRPHGNYRFFTVHYPDTILHRMGAQSPDMFNFISTQVELLEGGTSHTGYASNNIMQLMMGITGRQLPAPLLSTWLDNQLSGFLIELFVEIYNQSQPVIPIRQDDEIYRKAHDFILQNISEHFTISQIARHLHINEVYLKTGFKKQYGTGVYEFLKQQRMKHARHLLLTTDIPTKEISSIVGFDHITNFVAAFKYYFKYTPGLLRRKK